jgi:hypothetical protein
MRIVSRRDPEIRTIESVTVVVVRPVAGSTTRVVLCVAESGSAVSKADVSRDSAGAAEELGYRCGLGAGAGAGIGTLPCTSVAVSFGVIRGGAAWTGIVSIGVDGGITESRAGATGAPSALVTTVPPGVCERKPPRDNPLPTPSVGAVGTTAVLPTMTASLVRARAK